MKEASSSVDLILTEYWSYNLYKKGRKPLPGDEPGQKIRKGIWRDDGVDLNLLAKDRGIGINDLDVGSLFTTESIEVKEGLFRKRRKHLILKGVKELREIIGPPAKGKDPMKMERTEDLLSSDILFPLVIFNTGSSLDPVISSLKTARRVQVDTYDLNPETMLKRRKVTGDKKIAGENIKDLYGRKIDKDRRFRTPAGRRLNTLGNVFEYLFTCGDDELSTVIRTSPLIRYASDGLSSNVLEALFRDLSEDTSGDEETPLNFRIRLGRWLMESPLGDRIATDLVPLLVRRLETCPSGEAPQLEASISTLMDTRSTGLLIEKVFEVEPSKRPFFIRLLGSTGDRAAVEPLERLMKFSSIEKDRISAEKALDTMGVRTGS